MINRRTFVAGAAVLAASAASDALEGKHSASSQAASETAGTADALTPVLREKLSHDTLRPQFHLLPRSNWMNDPCAPRYHRGEYHVFFQYNPGAAVWGNMHWAHATSPDLVHWKHQPVALAPAAGSYDAHGCFTGSVLPGMATPSILYTGTTKCAPAQETIRGEGLLEVQCLASSSDPELKTWHKLDAPVIATPPPGFKVTGFRDPCPWKEGDNWYLIVGSGLEKVGGCVLLYRSRDGRAWEYLHPLAQGVWNGGAQSNPVDTGEMWECPDFFPLGGKHVLLYSTERKVYWEVGTLDPRELRFHMEKRGELDRGAYYAMKSMLDPRGRRLLWAWVPEKRTDTALVAAGWAGCMALPRVLSIDADGGLRMEVPPEFDAIVGPPMMWTATGANTSTLSQRLATMPIQDRAGKLSCSFRASADWALEWRSGEQQVLRLKYSTQTRSLEAGGKTLAAHPGADGISTLHVWMDGSVIEIFLDGREAVTLRYYGDTPESIRLHPEGAEGALSRVAVSSVRPISSDRLTT